MTPSLTIALVVLVSLVILLIWHNSRDTDRIDRRLLGAVKGDKALAKRLLAQARVKHPGKPNKWYVEKIIYDIERDHAGSRGL